MKETIRFKGLTLNGDEQSAQHGELSLCGNVELHDGALRPSVLKGTEIGSESTQGLLGTLLYVHTSTSYTNYITFIYNSANDYKLCRALPASYGWVYIEILLYDPVGHPDNSIDFGNVRSVTSVGNTLCILTDVGLFYALYKNNSYTLLGQQPPFLELQFNLKLDTYDIVLNPTGTDGDKNRDTHTVQVSEEWVGDAGEGVRVEVKEEMRSAVTEQVLAEINKRVDELTGEGFFYAPFLVRYCYRMFDGSMFMHSAPVLMASMLAHPVHVWNLFTPVAGSSDSNKYRIILFRCALQACCVDSSVITALQNWSDVIKSVDVFVTPQFSRIDTSGTIDAVDYFTKDSHDWCTFDGKTLTAKQLINAMYDYGQDFDHWGFEIPEYSEEEFFSRIKNASAFYRLCSFNITSLSDFFTASNLFKTLEYDGYILKNITVQEQMNDDYKTHNLLSPMDANSGGMYVYNHRLNLYGIKEKLFSGFSIRMLFPYADPEIPLDQNNPWHLYVSPDIWHPFRVEVAINTDSGVRYVTLMSPDNLQVGGDPWYAFEWMIKYGYIFYPDSRGVRMEFSFFGGVSSVYRELEDSPSLNGAFSFFAKSNPTTQLSGTINDLVPLPNKLYTSRADNPFYFPNLPGESGINSVGTGNIIGLAAVTRALSPGQVGDHDLLVFATDGIWALKVSSTGTYTAMHNISREVCTNPESICQLDQSVVFATKRSLSQIRESDVRSISDVLDGPILNLSTLLPRLNSDLTAGSEVKKLFDFGTPAISMFQSGKVLYDFASARLIVFNDTPTGSHIALVYSLKDMAWSTMCTGYVRAVVPGYPSPYIQMDVLKNNQQIPSLFSLDLPYDHDKLTGRDGIIVTRTLTYSDTMDVLRGFRQYTDAATMPTLYFFGSNDQRTWKFIGTTNRSFYNYAPGHPVRFFRIAMLLSLKMSERYQQLALEIINKYAKL